MSLIILTFGLMASCGFIASGTLCGTGFTTIGTTLSAGSARRTGNGSASTLKAQFRCRSSYAPVTCEQI